MAFNPLGLFYSLGETFLRIFRNKRRSMAMLSGVMLGTLIFSSIFIYTGVLKQETYESVIKQISYEVSFTLNEPGTEDDVWALADKINDDKRVESLTVFIGGTPGGGTDPFGDTDMMSMGPIVSAKIDGDVTVQQQTENQARPAIAGIKPVFVGDNFTSTTIYDKLIGDRIEGIFDFSRPGNWVVLPRTTAIRMNLVVGDVLPAISVTCFSLNGEGGAAREMFEDVTIAAFYEGTDSLDPFAAGLGLETIYLSSNMLDSGSQLRKAFEDNGLITLAVKIEKEEFNTGDLVALNKQVNQFVNDIARDSDDVLSGTNNASMILGIFQIQNILLFNLILKK